MIYIVHTPLGATESQTYNPLNSVIASHEFDAMVKGTVVPDPVTGEKSVKHFLSLAEQASAQLVEEYEERVLDTDTNTMVKVSNTRVIAEWTNDDVAPAPASDPTSSPAEPASPPADLPAPSSDAPAPAENSAPSEPAPPADLSVAPTDTPAAS